MRDKKEVALYIDDPNIFRVSLENYGVRYYLSEGSMYKHLFLVRPNEKRKGETQYVLKFVPNSELGKMHPDELHN